MCGWIEGRKWETADFILEGKGIERFGGKWKYRVRCVWDSYENYIISIIDTWVKLFWFESLTSLMVCLNLTLSCHKD